MDVLTHLTEEHRKVEAMLAVLADSEPGDERESTVWELEEALSTHMLVEEQFVYPIVKEELGTEEFNPLIAVIDWSGDSPRNERAGWLLVLRGKIYDGYEER